MFRSATEGRLIAMAAPLLEEIPELTVAERLELVEEVWDSIVDAKSIAITRRTLFLGKKSAYNSGPRSDAAHGPPPR